MSNPVAGVAMPSRWFLVILGIKIPFEVDFISSKEEASGVTVPMPALPVDGKMFVCAKVFATVKNTIRSNKCFIKVFYIKNVLNTFR